MSVREVSHMRTRDRDIELFINVWEKEIGRFGHYERMMLGSIETERELLKKIFQKCGPGKYSVKLMSPSITGLWTGWLLDNTEKELVVRVKLDDEGEPMNDLDQIGLEKLDYSRQGEVSLQKKQRGGRS
jgi:hypothetical protein